MSEPPAGAPDLEAVADDVVARSPLRGRLVVVLDASGSDAGAELGRALADHADVAAVVSSAVFAAGVPRMLGNHRLSRDAGLGTLVPLAVLLGATRHLVDDLLSRAGAGAGFVVEVAGDDTDPVVVRSIYPDATVVAIGGQAIPADLHVDPEHVQASPAELARKVLDTASVRRAPEVRPERPVAPHSSLQDRLVLVFGVPRSGTTWLEQLLLAHPRTAGVDQGETWIFQAIRGFWENHEGALGLHHLVDRATLATALRRFCDELLLHRLRQVDGATHFVEKTPGHAWLLPWIAEVYPDAWYLHLVRDGRDVSRSVAEMVHGTNDVREAAEQWAATVRRVSSTSGRLGRFREVRYEAVLADPVGAAADLLTWAGVEVDDGDRRAIEVEASVRVSRHGTTGSVGSGKWATMSAAERRVVLSTAGDVLTEFGYATTGEVRAARRALRRPPGMLAERWRRAAASVRSRR